MGPDRAALSAGSVLGLLGALSTSSACRKDEARPGAEVDLPRALLAASGGEAAVTPGLAALEPVVTLARLRLGASAGDEAVVRLNRLVFDELGFAREIDDKAPRFMDLAAVLASRRGSCVGLGLLYLALGDRLGLPLAGVLVPGHFFVRHGERNIELLRRGEAMPESWYRARYGLPEGAVPRAYLRALSRREALAVVAFNLGNDHRTHGRLEQAAAAYASAARDFPDFAEAHASLGLVRQLQGDRGGARRAYLAARAAYPALPGLAHNLELLDAPGLAIPTAVGPAATVP
jgi:regulator of sirC expression with transglutaminase-like and TPR domain